MPKGGLCMNGNKKDSLKDVWIGIGISVGIYLASMVSLVLYLGPYAILAGVVVQIILIIISFKKGNKRLGQGFLIGLGFTILLTAACFGLIFPNP